MASPILLAALLLWRHIIIVILLNSFQTSADRGDWYSHAECWFPNGDRAWKDNPCNDDGNNSTCCPLGSECMSNNLCFFPGPDIYERHSCTDRSWEDPNCLNICSRGEFRLIVFLKCVLSISDTEQVELHLTPRKSGTAVTDWTPQRSILGAAIVSTKIAAGELTVAAYPETMARMVRSRQRGGHCKVGLKLPPQLHPSFPTVPPLQLRRSRGATMMRRLHQQVPVSNNL
jgi:hypothetical protein